MLPARLRLEQRDGFEKVHYRIRSVVVGVGIAVAVAAEVAFVAVRKAQGVAGAAEWCAHQMGMRDGVVAVVPHTGKRTTQGIDRSRFQRVHWYVVDNVVGMAIDYALDFREERGGTAAEDPDHQIVDVGLVGKMQDP